MLALVQVSGDYSSSWNPASSTCIHVGQIRHFQCNWVFILDTHGANGTVYCVRLAGMWCHQCRGTKAMQGVVGGEESK